MQEVYLLLVALYYTRRASYEATSLVTLEHSAYAATATPSTPSGASIHVVPVRMIYPAMPSARSQKIIPYTRISLMTGVAAVS